MPEEQRNFLIALALSLFVIIAWEMWFARPSVDQTKLPAAQMKQPAPQAQTQTLAPTHRPDSIWQGYAHASPRIRLNTQRLAGSVRQTGALFDDLLLTDYRQTIDENSPSVRLLRANRFDAVFGFRAGGADIIHAETPWQTAQNILTQAKTLTLTYQDEKTQLQFRRQISIDENYMFQIKDVIVNMGQQAQSVSAWGMVRRLNRPPISGFYLLHEGLIGFFSEDGLEEIDYDDLEDDPNLKFNSDKGWLGITDKYWAVILIPDQRYPFQAQFSRSVAPEGEIFTANNVSPVFQLQAGERLTLTRHLFAGAKETELVDRYMESLPITKFELIIDWGWFFFITKPLFLLLDYFSKLLGNFGVSILIVTILVKLVFFPLVNKSYETMAVMRRIQPEIENVRARHQGDMMAQNQAIAELWKKHEVKPLMGCMPMMLQIPVFFALYKVLFVTIEMRHAPFFGWVQDLSAADPTSLLTLFGLIPIPLPDFLIIGIWPLLMGFSMFVQMRLNPPPPDPIQRKIFAWAPIVITLLLARFPAGLVIYATWNTVLSALQQGVIMKRQGVKIGLLDNLRVKK